MKVGITVRFLNSYFSGGIPQVACSLAKALQTANHDVTLLYPKGEQDWFMDVKGLTETLPPRKSWDPTSTDRYDAVFEVVWSFPEADRPKVAKHVILWAHQPPIFHDIESSVYQWNATQRSFKNLTAIATYDFYTAQDVRYLEFLSGVQVIQVPFLWNQEALTIFCEENNTPEWKESAKRIEGMLPKETHPSVSWCARIVESNFSNTSHCNIPLNILTQIRVRGDPVRFNVHNGEQIGTNEFFKSNIVKNLLLPDISGSVVPRVRMPDLRQEKSFIIAHQRFRPLKMFMLDALYLGIPLIHNCELLTEMGVPYGYKLNQIQDAANAWLKLKKDYENDKLLFNTSVHGAIKVKLVKRFSPVALSTTYNELLKRAITPKSIPKPLIPHNQAKELRVHPAPCLALALQQHLLPYLDRLYVPEPHGPALPSHWQGVRAHPVLLPGVPRPRPGRPGGPGGPVRARAVPGPGLPPGPRPQARQAGRLGGPGRGGPGGAIRDRPARLHVQHLRPSGRAGAAQQQRAGGHGGRTVQRRSPALAGLHQAHRPLPLHV